MAREFNVTAADKWFLGEDKVLQFTVYGQDDVTPLDVTGMTMEWSLKKADKTPDPGILEKSTGAGTITIVGVYNASPVLNTQRVRITFTDEETDPVATSVLPSPYTLAANKQYRHSLKRMDTNNEGIFSYGYIIFLQATEH